MVFISPLGKKLRSRIEVQNYCQQNNIEVNLDMFQFRRISSENAVVAKRKSAPLTKTPKAEKVKKVKIPKSEGS